MNEYEIGRDLQSLRSRIEQLEGVCCERPSRAGTRHEGVSTTHTVHSGVALHQEPVHWKPEPTVQLPPFFLSLIGLAQHEREHGAKFHVVPESKTWKADPLILSIRWASGGTDEFYRFQDQVFSVFRLTDPNTNQVSCSAIYSAQLVASGRAKSHYVPPPGQFDPNVADAKYGPKSQLQINLRSAQGGFLDGNSSYEYSIDCHDNYVFVVTWEFKPALFDLVAGATWGVSGLQTVARC